MELERHNIEKRDFSQAKRGYDQDEVNRHLSAIAAAVEELQRTAAQPQQASLAGAAAARVEAIVAAAEAEARAIRDEAERDAASRVSGAQETVANLEARAAELQREVGDFVARIGGLKAAVDSLRAEADSVAAVPVPIEAAPVKAIELEVEPEPAPASEPAEPILTVVENPPEEPAAIAAPAKKGASEGARLVALNMALSGTPREETARYLRENYDLADEDALLDDVYAKVGS